MQSKFLYTPADRPITVGIELEDQVARVYVQDDGPGLSEVDQVRIWERFYRASDDEGQRVPGTSLGLGLYICRTIIEQHGGQTGVISTLGRGATFWFTLPREEAVS